VRREEEQSEAEAGLYRYVGGASVVQALVA
jgi:hypothetical protein